MTSSCVLVVRNIKVYCGKPYILACKRETWLKLTGRYLVKTGMHINIVHGTYVFVQLLMNTVAGYLWSTLVFSQLNCYVSGVLGHLEVRVGGRKPNLLVGVGSGVIGMIFQ